MFFHGDLAATADRIADRTLKFDYSEWFWGDAIALDGLLEVSAMTGKSRYRDAVYRYVDRWLRKGARSYFDHMAPGTAVVNFYRELKEPRLLAAAESLAEYLHREVPRSWHGAPLYRPDLPMYRNTVWVDTLYHEPTFFYHLAQVTGNDRYYDGGTDVIRTHVKALFNEETSLFPQARNMGTWGMSGYGWARGNAWALLGFVDALALLPQSRPEYDELKTLTQRMIKAIVALEAESTGLWHTLIHQPGTYLEASTAAFFGAALEKAMRFGVIGPEYRTVTERAWQAVASRIDSEGGFTEVSACTWAATSDRNDEVAYYNSVPFEINPWGQGSAMRILCERLYTKQ